MQGINRLKTGTQCRSLVLKATKFTPSDSPCQQPSPRHPFLVASRSRSEIRQVVIMVMLAAIGHMPNSKCISLGHCACGWTRTERVEFLIQAVVFAGIPAALDALSWAKEVFDA
jgi:hypothetical protein